MCRCQLLSWPWQLKIKNFWSFSIDWCRCEVPSMPMPHLLLVSFWKGKVLSADNMYTMQKLSSRGSGRCGSGEVLTQRLSTNGSKYSDCFTWYVPPVVTLRGYFATQYTCVFRINLSINSDHFPKSTSVLYCYTWYVPPVLTLRGYFATQYTCVSYKSLNKYRSFPEKHNRLMLVIRRILCMISMNVSRQMASPSY
jgi:hypothetical protein